MPNKILLAFLNTYYPNSDIIPTKFQFFIPLKKFGSRFNSQFLHLFASLSKLAFSIPFEPPDRVMYWSNTVFYAIILSTVNATLSLRKVKRYFSFFAIFLAGANLPSYLHSPKKYQHLQKLEQRFTSQ